MQTASHAVLQAAGLAADAVAGHYASYLVELALPDYGMLKYSNSMVAVAAVQLTNRCASSPVNVQNTERPRKQAKSQPIHWPLLRAAECLPYRMSNNCSHLCVEVLCLTCS